MRSDAPAFPRRWCIAAAASLNIAEYLERSPSTYDEQIGVALAPRSEEGAIAMTLFVGLDVSVKETAVCVVDDTGKVVCE